MRASVASTYAPASDMHEHPVITWKEKGAEHSARWRSEAGVPPPKRVVIADDHMTADKAYQLACEGTAMLWRGDFQNARQLLQAMARRVDRPKGRRSGNDAKQSEAASSSDAFNRHRMAQAQRARILGMLLLPFEPDHGIPLRRAPDVREARLEADQVHDSSSERYVASMRELLGLIGAHEWRRKGVWIPALGARIHPHYGVWSPVRGEYVELVAAASLPAVLSSHNLAFDIGTGTGVLAAVLARRGVARVIATDQDPRALACARENMMRLGLNEQVGILHADLFPEGRAGLVVCNPPWVPARPSSMLERAVYDPESRMLRGFLAGLAAHLAPRGEGWLILSDLAEHLGLRTRSELLAWIEDAGLEVAGREDVKPQHPKAADREDPLHAARRAEVTSLWRLVAPHNCIE
jgi:methylase of polypeptide subunit release factors